MAVICGCGAATAEEEMLYMRCVVPRWPFSRGGVAVVTCLIGALEEEEEEEKMPSSCAGGGSGGGGMSRSDVLHW